MQSRINKEIENCYLKSFGSVDGAQRTQYTEDTQNLDHRNRARTKWSRKRNWFNKNTRLEPQNVLQFNNNNRSKKLYTNLETTKYTTTLRKERTNLSKSRKGLQQTKHKALRFTYEEQNTKKKAHTQALYKLQLQQ